MLKYIFTIIYIYDKNDKFIILFNNLDFSYVINNSNYYKI